jgi:hypothetical protein
LSGAVGVAVLLVVLPALLAALLFQVAEEVGVVVRGNDPARRRLPRAVRAMAIASTALLEEPDHDVDEQSQKRDDEQSLTHASRVGRAAKPRVTTLQG